VAFNLKDDPRMLQRLQNAAALASPKDIDAPAAEIPALTTLAVTVPVPPAPDEAAILARYRDKLRDRAVVTPRKPGDELQLGDEVCVSTVGFVNGAVVPGTIRHQHWIELVPDPSLPGFCEGLLDSVVGTSTVLPVILPEDFPSAQLKGKAAAFTVQIHEAQAIEMPHPESDETVALLALAPTLDGTLEQVALELAREAEDAAPLLAMAAVMRALAHAAVVDVPASAVDAEIVRTWKLAEGDACVALGLTVEEQGEALKHWQESAEIREEATLRLKAWAALKGVVRDEKLTPTDEGFARMLAAFAPTLDQTPDALFSEIKRDDKLFAELKELAFQMQVVDHVMAHAEITFVDV
jgi:trigger factor